MAEPSLKEQLMALPKGDDRAVDALARNFGRSVDQKTEELVEILKGEDAALADRAAAVLMALDARALPALGKATRPDPLAAGLWELELLSDLVLASRGSVVALLDGRLEDKRDVPMAGKSPGMEEGPLPRRACDAAYLMLRRLLSAENADAQFLNSRLFLKLSIEKRDSEIFFAKRERRFTDFSAE